MRVIYKNAGEYVDYALEGTVLRLRGGELTFDVSAIERDYPVKITIFEDGAGALTTTLARRYTAELSIPARRSVVESSGIADEFGFKVLRRVYQPTDMSLVELTLWDIGGERKNAWL